MKKYFLILLLRLGLIDLLNAATDLPSDVPEETIKRTRIESTDESVYFFKTLSNELVFQILERLPFRDRLNFGCTNQRMKKLASESCENILIDMNRVQLTPTSTVPLGEQFSYFLRRFKHMRTLKIANLNEDLLIESLTFLNPDFQFSLLSHLDLECQLDTIRSLQALAPRMPNLTWLNVRGPEGRGSDIGNEACRIIGEHFRKLSSVCLEETKLTLVGISALAQNLDHLQSLYIGINDKGIGAEEVELICQRWPTLKELGISSCNIDSRAIHLIRDRLPELTYLNIGTNTIDRASIGALMKMINLRHLHLYNIDFVKDGPDIQEDKMIDDLLMELRVQLPLAEINF